MTGTTGAPTTTTKKATAERDERSAVFEAQVANTAKNAETAEALRDEIARAKAQAESDCIDFRP